MASYMSDEKHNWICGHAIEEINRLRALKEKQKEAYSVRRKMKGLVEFIGDEIPINSQAKELQTRQMNYYDKCIAILDLKITIWTQIIEREKNPKMLDLFNETFNEFLQAGWEYLGQEDIEQQSKDALDEYKMFKLLLSQIPDKIKKTRRGGKKHKKKNKQAAEEE